jgi:hypothetical protein
LGVVVVVAAAGGEVSSGLGIFQIMIAPAIRIAIPTTTIRAMIRGIMFPDFFAGRSLDQPGD